MTEEMNKPCVDPEYVIQVFADLEVMEVELDADPLEFGPSRLALKIKECRDHLSRVERSSLQASSRLHRIKERYRSASKLYQIREARLLESDPEVRAGRSIDDRRALARLKLHEEYKEATWLEQGIEDMETVLDALKFKQNALKNIQIQIKEQRTLCNESIALTGRSWGHKDLPGAVLRPGQGRTDVDRALAEQDIIIRGEDEEELHLDQNPSVGSDATSPDSESEVGGDVEEATQSKKEEDLEVDEIDLIHPDETHDPTKEAVSSEEDILGFLDSDPDEIEGESKSKPAPVDIDSLLDNL